MKSGFYWHLSTTGWNKSGIWQCMSNCLYDLFFYANEALVSLENNPSFDHTLQYSASTMFHLGTGSTAKCSEHFNDTLYTRIHIDTQNVQNRISQVLSSGKGGKHRAVILLPGINSCNFAPPSTKKMSPECSSFPPAGLRDQKRWKSPLLVFLQNICWYDFDWAVAQVRKCLCGPILQKNTSDLKKKKKNLNSEWFQIVLPWRMS